MKYLWGVFTFLCLLIIPIEAQEEKSPPSVSFHAELLYKYLKSTEDGPYLRGLTYQNYYSRKRILAQRIKSMRFWINNLHLESGLSFPKEVPGSKGLLFVIDIRDFGWSKASFSAIARREPYCTDESIDTATAILLRKLIGVEQDPKTFHVEAMVRGDWFFRDTFELDRSDSYHDALFAKFRFGNETYEITPAKTEKWKYTDGSYREHTTPAVMGKRNSNFPKDEDDFEKVFAVDLFREHLKKFKIDTRHGAIVEGMEKGVSIVSRQNRLVERKITSTGSYYKTFDVKETVGKRDFAETLNTDFEFDAGEILTDLPGGGIGAALVNAKRDILKVADNRFATDSSDLRLDARVRTPGSCFICHELKYIVPQNLVEDMMKAGIDILFKHKNASVSARGFFLDWVDKLQAEQTSFTKFITRTSGFRPGQNALLLKEWRDEYDAPIILTTAANEVGLTEPQLKVVLIESTKARALMLLRGQSIPRRTFEVDVYPEIIHLIHGE